MCSMYKLIDLSGGGVSFKLLYPILIAQFWFIAFALMTFGTWLSDDFLCMLFYISFLVSGHAMVS